MLGQRNLPFVLCVFPPIFIFSFLGGNGSDGGMAGLDPNPNSVSGMLSAPRTSHRTSVILRFPFFKRGANVSDMYSELDPRQ